MAIDYALLSLSNLCNFNCRHCYVLKDHREDMTLGDINNIVDYFIDEIGIKTVNIIGGEPFLCKNVNIMLRKLQRHKDIQVEIVTNGSIHNKETIKLLRKVNLSLLKVSIHAFSGKNFNYFTQTKNQRQKVFDNIDFFVKTFPFWINITIMRSNYHEIIEMIKYFSIRGVTNFQISQFTPAGNGLTIKKTQLSRKKILEMKRRLMDEFSGCSIKIRYDDHTICKFGQLLAVNPRGEVFPCAALLSYSQFKVGTIYSSRAEIEKNIKVLLKRKKQLCFVEQFIKE